MAEQQPGIRTMRPRGRDPQFFCQNCKCKRYVECTCKRKKKEGEE